MTVQIEVQSDKLRDLIHKWETEKPQVAKPIDLSRLRSEIDKPPVWHDTRGIPRVITWTLKVLGYPKEQYYKKNHYEIVTMLSKDLSLRTAQIELWWLINESSKPGQKEVKRDYSDFKKGFSYSIPVFPQNSCDYIRRFAQILDNYRYEDWEYSLQQHSKFITDATSAQDLTASRKALMKTYSSTISAIAQDNNIDLVRYYEDIKELSLVLAARGSYLCNFANKQSIMDKAENIAQKNEDESLKYLGEETDDDILEVRRSPYPAIVDEVPKYIARGLTCEEITNDENFEFCDLAMFRYQQDQESNPLTPRSLLMATA